MSERKKKQYFSPFFSKNNSRKTAVQYLVKQTQKNNETHTQMHF